MPYKWQRDGTPMPRDKDRRVKLTDVQRDEIRRLYPDKSQRALARMFGVSRRTIQFVLDPAKRDANYQRRVERGGSKQYYDKDDWRETMREHRRYKTKVLKNHEPDS